ncbi:hypothetical protein OXX79_012337, partial [Metschnikowia pulcherrima]
MSQRPRNTQRRNDNKNFDRRNDRNDRRSGGNKQERPKREAILDLQKYYGEKVSVKFIGGR